MQTKSRVACYMQLVDCVTDGLVGATCCQRLRRFNLHHGDKLSLHSSHFFKLRKRDRGLTYAYWDRGSGDGGGYGGCGKKFKMATLIAVVTKK